MATLRVTAEEEFSKNPELKQEDLDELREFMKSKAHLPVISDEQLIMFVHSCYYKVSATKDCILQYYRLRAECSDVFTGRDLELPACQDIIQVMKYVELPVPDNNGYHVIFHRFCITEPSRYMFPVALKVFFMLIDACLIQHGTSPGVVFLLDAAGLRLGHILRLSLSLVRKGMSYLQEGMPVRLKAIHVVNSVYAVDQIMVLLKPFMNRELYNMIHFHKGNNETLYSYMPRKCLPQDYGGELPPIAQLHENSIADMKGLDKYFKEEEKQRCPPLSLDHF
ncbi:hypothetical protein L9F63_008581 [Diploptera punctata]|uniref:CRAL-TRIO domain-containing protein n=1 Tax=Diploptera punctata TaxID=6984 RepID=A0AAD7Z4I1_DIPPU|nr:hypothetical protein L9F63_008581 [Diploptera punctata]